MTSTNPDIRFLGVQWHPEMLCHKRQEEKDLFDYVVNKL
ncbi:glutamine amidotransferase, class I family protein [Streptococcus urinalis 2285-97]|uniref:Glutamine amidotransferase, class I family protein n=1 Tax=Streptococcus urinalis 2285-97 TaxID=764291 RepID=G5KFR2_9STRE|nr:glutamine amidotransferase, class I family protein [Streptococcus urinalis 2285-97]